MIVEQISELGPGPKNKDVCQGDKSAIGASMTEAALVIKKRKEKKTLSDGRLQLGKPQPRH